MRSARSARWAGGGGGEAAGRWRYPADRASLQRLHGRMLAHLTRPTIARALLDLDLGSVGPRPGTHGFDLLLEYALYDGRLVPEQPTVVERFVAGGLPIREDGPDARWRRWLRTARYALLEVRRPRPAEGAEVIDLVRGDRPIRLADQGLGATAVRGLTIAARVVRTDRHWMTTGAPIVVDDAGRAAILRQLRAARSNGAAPVAARILRICLARGLAAADPADPADAARRA